MVCAEDSVICRDLGMASARSLSITLGMWVVMKGFKENRDMVRSLRRSVLMLFGE